MIVYQLERAYCDECGTGVSIYPGGAFGVQRGEYILDDACCYKHGVIPFERALFRSGNPADYPMATPTPRLPPPRQWVEEEWDEEKVTHEMEISHYLYFLSLSNKIGGSEEIPPLPT
jgi:hypothetical protein